MRDGIRRPQPTFVDPAATAPTASRAGAGRALPRTTAALAACPTLRARPHTVRLSAAPGAGGGPAAVQIANEGTEPFAIDGVELLASLDELFPIYGATDGALAPGATADVHVAFRPKDRRARRDQLAILAAGAPAATV